MSIKHKLDDMINNVIDEYSCEISKNEKYTKLAEEYSNLFDTLMELLPEENRKILFNLDSAANSLECITERLIYEKGLKDGAELKSIVKIVS